MDAAFVFFFLYLENPFIKTVNRLLYDCIIIKLQQNSMIFFSFLVSVLFYSFFFLKSKLKTNKQKKSFFSNKLEDAKQNKKTNKKNLK